MSARRYYKKDYRFWGYVREPGKPWTASRLVMLNEQRLHAPDREAWKIGSITTTSTRSVAFIPATHRV